MKKTLNSSLGEFEEIYFPTCPCYEKNSKSLFGQCQSVNTARNQASIFNYESIMIE